jgi:branched-chain amino acid transport system ATP-binding protein
VNGSIDGDGLDVGGLGNGGPVNGGLVNGGLGSDSGATGHTVLELRGVKRHFGGIRAVDGVTLMIQESTVTALIGPNGAGKSTLFALMMGEIPLTAGEMLLDGRDVRAHSPERRSRLGLGRTFQTPRLFSGLSVRENVQIALLASLRRTRSLPSSVSVPRSERMSHSGQLRRSEQDVALALEEVGLSEQAKLDAAALSQGQRKRLELAMVLALQPRVLLLDEPTAGMGVGERARIMELVMAVVGRRALTMLFTEHDMETVFAHAKRVVVMDRGVLVADGLPQAVRRDPHVQQVYLGRQR